MIYDGLAQYGNPGNWAWIEDREALTVCERCRVVYPPGAKRCPRHGPLTQLPSDRFTLRMVLPEPDLVE